MKKADQLIAQNRERWHTSVIEESSINEIMLKFGLSPRLAKIILARKIGDESAIEAFLNPPKTLRYDCDGISTKDQLEKALKRVKSAIDNKELIIINGDPDADGITGTTILVAALRFLGVNVDYDFPARSREGHGLQVRIIEKAKQQGSKLIITTDCGSQDIEATRYAVDNGIDVIITDHHIIGKTLPPAHAVINPHLVQEPTAFKKCAGSTVSLKFIQALFNYIDTELPEPVLDFFTACATLGTLSDRMSMRDPLNRRLVKEGIRALQTTKREGLKALKRVCGESGPIIRPRSLSRTIIPRLNAPGRIGDPEAGIPDSNMVVSLLLIGSGKKNIQKASVIAEQFSAVVELEKELKNKERSGPVTKDDRTAMSSAVSVDDVNEQRKYMTNKIEEEIDQIIDEQVDINDKIIIVQGKNWNSGVIGIDTDRLKERFLRPATILTQFDGDDYVRGSCRSIPKINLYRLIDQVGEKFESLYNRMLFGIEVKSENGTRKVNAFGGHSQACGFTLHKDDVSEFIRLIREEVDQLPEEQFEYHYDIIDTLSFDEISPALITELDKILPYGQEFDFPIFSLKECSISSGRSFGNKYQEVSKPHVTFKVGQGGIKGVERQFDAVGFGLWEKFCLMRSTIDPMMRYDVICVVEFDLHRRGRDKKPRIRLNVLDIRQSKQNR
jgi:single-stranded-DNA-specific exonuclease